MRRVHASLLAIPLVLAAVPAAFAQGTPSADQIIQSLKPSGNLLQGETRGIRLANPTADTAQTPAAAAPADPSVSLTVEFASGSATLTPQARQALDQLGRALSSKDLAQYKFRIEGHTDTVGTPDANKSLSQRRAETVAGYLEKTYGVAPTRLQSVGMGEDGLLVATPPQTANAQNRRVKVVNLGA